MLPNYAHVALIQIGRVAKLGLYMSNFHDSNLVECSNISISSNSFISCICCQTRHRQLRFWVGMVANLGLCKFSMFSIGTMHILSYSNLRRGVS